jgi:hypothetical protein
LTRLLIVATATAQIAAACLGRSAHATLRHGGGRLDEARYAAVAEVSRRLAAGFELAGPAIARGHRLAKLLPLLGGLFRLVTAPSAG